jgi:hypothetical protein
MSLEIRGKRAGPIPRYTELGARVIQIQTLCVDDLYEQRHVLIFR